MAFFLTSGLGANRAMAVAPDNDMFSAATPISLSSGTIAGSSVDATAETDEPDHYNPAHHSIWYQWTAPVEGTPAAISFDTLGSSFEFETVSYQVDTVLAVYTANTLLPVVNHLAQLVSNDDDDAGNVTSKVFFIPTAGTTYYIAIDGYDAACDGEYCGYGSTVLNWAAADVADIPVRTLTLSKDGTGSGTLVPDVGVHDYYDGTWAELSATADSGSTFTGWTGACVSAGTTSPISVLMDGDKACAATFTLMTAPQTLTVVKTGSGTVTSAPAGIDCGNDCSEVYELDTQVTLTATPDDNYTFDGWSGGNCTGTQGCAVTMDADITVTATFKKKFPWAMILPAITRGVQQ